MERKMQIKFDFEKFISQGEFWAAEVEAELDMYTQEDCESAYKIVAVWPVLDDGYISTQRLNPETDDVPYLDEIIEIAKEKWRDLVGYQEEEEPLQPWDFC
jgi:predicted phage-related endonuclease